MATLFSPPFAKFTVTFLAAWAACVAVIPLSRSALNVATRTPFSTAVFTLSKTFNKLLIFFPINCCFCNPNLPFMVFSLTSSKRPFVFSIISCKSLIWLVAFFPPASSNFLYSIAQGSLLPLFLNSLTIPITALPAPRVTSFVNPFSSYC